MNKFTTTANSFKSALITTIVCCAIGVGVGVWLAIASDLTIGLMICGMVLVCGVALFFEAKKGTQWVIEVEDDVMYIENVGKKQRFKVCDTPASDIVLMQSKGQKEKNVGDMMIKFTKLSVGNIQNFEEFRNFINMNFR